MAKKAAVREVIYLACIQCQQRSYTSSKNRRNDPQRLELNKFCPRCRAHTQHRETK
ncbi:MAG: 50S ribosomal protein L33 [Dehalococcoidia bacterium]|nr:50S ribosomal protein L33 [Dehalococcoidia bacterium]MDP7469685.1 50S ribosomal protein L33 [Dehalococcoidia bacterium]